MGNVPNDPIDPVIVRTKFEVRSLPIPEIIGGTPKIWTVPGYAHAPFCSDVRCTL